jgi:RimJ/RimL family protein N-acetyltransferase
MNLEERSDIALTGRIVRLEPLGLQHRAALLAAARAGNDELYRWSFVPRDAAAMQTYIETAVRLREERSALPFAIVRLSDETPVGSTRFFDFERWPWPQGYDNRGRPFDACEIGYTWLAPGAIRTAVNTEAKLLLLAHAFETWNLRRVVFHTDERNERSRNAIARLGAKFEGISRAYRVATDLTPRNSARFSILAGEWPEVKAKLTAALRRRTGGASVDEAHGGARVDQAQGDKA